MSDDTGMPRELTAKSAYLALLWSLPALFLFIYLGKWETGIGAWICFGLVALVIRTRWDLRKRVWFWIVIVVAAFLQMPIIFLIPWQDRNMTGISLLPVVVVDYGFIYGSIKLIERCTDKTNGINSEN